MRARTPLYIASKSVTTRLRERSARMTIIFGLSGFIFVVVYDGILLESMQSSLLFDSYQYKSRIYVLQPPFSSQAWHAPRDDYPFFPPFVELFLAFLHWSQARFPRSNLCSEWSHTPMGEHSLSAVEYQCVYLPRGRGGVDYECDSYRDIDYTFFLRLARKDEETFWHCPGSTICLYTKRLFDHASHGGRQPHLHRFSEKSRYRHADEYILVWHGDVATRRYLSDGRR